jgi:CRP/FNR family transcriptional regulator, cyclic AMP receptor protein
VQEKPQDQALARRIATLRTMPIFADLAERDLAGLVDDLRSKEYAKDDTIFRQGDESREVYFLRKGKVRIFKISPGGNETSIAIFTTNDVIGELAAIDQEPRSASAKAMTPVSLLAMSQERFLYTLQTVPRFGMGMARLLAHKLRWTAAFAESIAQFDAAGRLLHIILQHNDQYGELLEPGTRYQVNIGLNQSDLASMVGARREWVNRILSEWRRRGLLEFDNGVITILDLPRVRAERDSRIEANQGEW